MPPKRSITRKRQAKLAFEPVSASSPAVASLSPQVRGRAAAVAVEGSPSRPSKKRRLIQLPDDSESDELLLPTPKKSFQSNDFSSPNGQELRRSMKMGMPVESKKYGMFGGSDDDGVPLVSSSSDSDEELDTPKKRTNATKRKRSKPISSESEQEEAPELPAKKKANGKKKTERKCQTRSKPAASDGSNSDTNEKQPKPNIRQTRAKNRRKDESPPLKVKSENDSEPDPMQESPPKKTRSTKATASGGTQPRKQTRQTKRKTKAESPEIESDEGEVDQIHEPPPAIESSEEESEDEVRPPPTQRRMLKRKRAVSESEGDQSDDQGDEESDDEEKRELKEELEFLQSSPPPSRDRLRSGHSKPLSERAKALAALKKRRAAASSSVAPTSSASTPGRKRAVVVDSDDAESDSSLEVIEEEDESGSSEEEEGSEADVNDEFSGSGPTTLPGRSKNTSALDIFQENEGDADFIVEDDDEPLGEPADQAHIPLEFTSLGRAKPRELFKYVVEWMVKKKISPAFSSDDEIYDLAFRKLDDEVKGLANSKYTSSAWTPEFMRTLRARPEIFIDEIGKGLRGLMMDHCEACNRSGHTATWNITFTGKPYNKHTLEPLREDSDSESDSDSDSSLSSHSDSGNELGYKSGEKRDYDAQGEVLPPESKVFAVGSTCKANAQMAHTLNHWRHRLYTWVQDYLVRKGHCTPEMLVKRDKQSERKREKAANKIVDQMEKDGEIRKLHHLYKDQVDFALEEQNDYKRGWGRR